MKILTRKYSVKENIERVFYCFSDVDYILKEIKQFDKNSEFKVVKKGDVLAFRNKSTLFSLIQLQAQKPFLYRAQITPIDKILLKFGNAILTCTFTENGKTTSVLVEIHSEKDPGLLWKVFIRIIVFIFMIQSRADEKQYIKRIEQSA